MGLLAALALPPMGMGQAGVGRGRGRGRQQPLGARASLGLPWKQAGSRLIAR